MLYLKTEANQVTEAERKAAIKRKKSAKQVYDEYYDDVKQPSRYIKEDW